MPSILTVTAFCRNDVDLLRKRSDWLLALEPIQEKSLLLVNDGTVDNSTCQQLVSLYSRNFRNVIYRSLLSPPDSGEWPKNVNYVWRHVAKLVAGKYGEKINVSDFFAWFYFEPDVTPLKAGWIQALESEYMRHKKPFLGKVNITQGIRTDERTKVSVKENIYHMNGAGVYPIVTDYYNANMMLVDNLPWDVAGLSNYGGGLIKTADLGEDFYAMGFGTRGYSKDGNTLRAKQTIADVTSDYSFTLNKQYLHHGCKDGSLMDCLNDKEVINTTDTHNYPLTNAASSTLPATPPKVALPARLQNIQPLVKATVRFDAKGNVIDETQIKKSTPMKKLDKEKIDEIKQDKADGLTWKELIAKHKVPPAQLSKILKG